MDGHFGEVGPADCGPGMHYIERDLEEREIQVDTEYTPWLWAVVIFALNWDVPKK